MKVLIAPDSFKGTYSAGEVAAAIAAGVHDSGANACTIPLADGGEGTLEVLTTITQAQTHTVTVQNPWGQPIPATFAITPDNVGIVELAQASGITVPHTGIRDPWGASTYGTGQLMVAARERGARHIVVSAGGSATSDGGDGAIRAIEQAGGIHNIPITVLTDVTTPFELAGKIFSPQKGATPAVVEQITTRLAQQAVTLPKNPVGVPRTGAAGGFSGGMWAQYNAELVSGADYVLEFVGFDQALRTVDAVVVGEGKLDAQTRQGKIVDAVITRVRRHNPDIPVIAVVGSVSDDLGEYANHFTTIIEATDTAAMRAAGQRISGN